MTLIKNREQLLSHGNQALRMAAIDILEAGLAAADPYKATHRLVRRQGDELSVGDMRLHLSQFDRVFILGTGKASRGIGQALEEILGDRIAGGVFVLKHGDQANLRFVKVIYAGHPVPDENSYSGACALLGLSSSCTERDLVFAAITGGSSALVSYPVPGMTFQDKRRVHELLLLSGADIHQVNAVRKHLSRIKGGCLARAVLPATLVNLTVSDVVGDALDYITDPTVPDTSTFEDARAVLDEFDLWGDFPPAAAEYLRAGNHELETAKDFDGLPLFSFLLVPSDASALGALERARALGFQSMILTVRLEGEAREAGKFLAAIGQEVCLRRRPVPPPCCIIVAGENTVSIGSGARGEGGPNQELALSASLGMRSLDNMLIASLDTDGEDGTTEAAGAMVENSTVTTARAKGLDPRMALKRHDTYPFLRETGDLIQTGPTGTNVSDLYLLLTGSHAGDLGGGEAGRHDCAS